MASRTFKIISYLILFLAVVAFLVPGLRTTHLFDDAYMFSRYADHLVRGEGLCWNVSDGSIYGPTSLTFVLLVALFRLMVSNPAVLLTLCSGVGLFFATTMLVRLCKKVSADEPSLKQWQFLYPLALAAALLQPFFYHGYTGMDTSMATGAVALYALLWLKFEKSPQLTSTFLNGIVGGILYAVRPELTLCACLIPAVMFFLRPDMRKWIVVSVLLTLVTTGSIMLMMLLMAGSPVPLSFYIKGIQYYDEAFTADYRNLSLGHGLSFLGRSWPLWAALAAGIWMLVKQRAKVPPLAVAAGAVVIAHCIYSTFFVLQVMGMGSRFYFPVVPLLLLAALKTGAPVIRWFTSGKKIKWVPFAFIAWFGVNLGDGSYKVVKHISQNQSHNIFNLQDIFHSKYSDYWYRLDQFSELPDDAVFATTEVGLISALNPRKEIYDLAGLNDQSLATGQQDVAALILEKEVDLFYTPMVNYVELNRQITNSSEIREQYDLFSRAELHARMGVAVRKSSKYYSRMLEILGKK